MENLNDVEFGSDKDKEEAPILVAQRYLNIYRQIHIFNKEKRDQFDDELLALPANIFEFFKRMPGGRLLVEHIEEVKTERGISFVKSSKEDFAEGSGTSTTPAPASGGAVAPIVGGSVTVDASFAEALAQSMANAFKQNPMQATVSGGSAVGGKIDFGNAFDVIAEEIKTSRASLLDVLRETRSITDSVIASQVSISRILEGILSARTKEDIGAADLNNRIIASQASITKLLEGLYLTNNQKNNEITNYLNIEKKLQSFQNEMRAEIEQSLNRMQEMFLECTKSFGDKKVVIETKETTLKHDDIKSISNLVASTIKEHSNITKEANVKVTPPSFVNEERTFMQNSPLGENDATKKKKKKKKNKNNQFSNNEVSENTNLINKPNNIVEKSTINAVGAPVLGGVIHNEAFKHNDKFDNVNLNTPPLDDFENETNDDIMSSDINLDFDNLSDIDTVSDFNIDEQTPNFAKNIDLDEDLELDEESELEFPNTIKDEITPLDNLDNDGLSFDLPEQNTGLNDETPKEDAFASLDDITDDGLSFDLPEQNTGFNDETPNEDTFASLDDIADDGLSFDLPEQNTGFNDETPNEDTFANLDDIADDGLSFDLPEQNTGLNDETPKENTFASLDDIADDGLSFDLPEQNTGLNDETPKEDTFANLDDIADDGLSFDLPEQHIDIEEDTSVNSANSDNFSVDDFFNSNTTIDEQQTSTQTTSRYSAELDKIRAALTSDNIDISSLDEPIALDDYSDDENVPLDDYAEASDDTTEDWEYEYVEEDNANINVIDQESAITTDVQNIDNNEEWDWEYVDENGNPIEGTDEEGDWEWEYVEEEDTGNNPNNNNQ